MLNIPELMRTDENQPAANLDAFTFVLNVDYVLPDQIKIPSEGYVLYCTEVYAACAAATCAEFYSYCPV